MRVIPSQIATALVDMEATKGFEPKVLARSVAHWLSRRRGGEKVFQQIIKEVERQLRERLHEERVVVTTAHTLGEQSLRGVERQVREFFPEKTVQMSVVVDPSLIGGMKIETQEMCWDASLTRRIDKLRSKLLQ